MRHIFKNSPLACRYLRTSLAALLAMALLPSCATTQETGLETTNYVVTAETTPFWRLGPQQGQGPDQVLNRGGLVQMLRRSYGYSQVELADGRSGYVATSDLGPASEEDMAVASPDASLLSPAIVERYSVEGSGTSAAGSPPAPSRPTPPGPERDLPLMDSLDTDTTPPAAPPLSDAPVVDESSETVGEGEAPAFRF